MKAPTWFIISVYTLSVLIKLIDLITNGQQHLNLIFKNLKQKSNKAYTCYAGISCLSIFRDITANWESR